MAAPEDVAALQAEITRREEELASLKRRLAAALTAEPEPERPLRVPPPWWAAAGWAARWRSTWRRPA